MIEDLPLIADAIRAHPDIIGVKRRAPDDCIDQLTWIVFVQPGWRTCDQGSGPTIEAAYQNAIANRDGLKVAA